MKDRPYHHGNLQTELIEEGLALIHEEGRENFSLRKLVKRLGVSPTACYNHFLTVEDLLCEMKNYVTNKFTYALKEGAESGEKLCHSINMGKAYVNFFAENPHYFSFIYDSQDYKIELTMNKFEGDFEPFRVFKKISLECLKNNNIKKENMNDDLIVMWATVHGLAAMANMKGFRYDGNWGELTRRLLETKILL